MPLLILRNFVLNILLLQKLSYPEISRHLLQKIEELTLYIIQQEKRIKALEDDLNKKE